jgi:integrase
MPTRPTWTSRWGTGSGAARSRKAGSRSSRPPTQVRHTHASWLIDAGKNPKAVHRLGQADLRTTARYVNVLDETGESAARRFERLLPPL